jgi:hypothetical protein
MRKRPRHLILSVVVLMMFQLNVAVVDAQTSTADLTLVGWWKLDEGGGATVIDSSRYGNDSNLMTALAAVEGRIDGAREFNGTSDYVEFPSSAEFDITDAVTIAMWVKTNTIGDGLHKALLMKGEFTYGMRFTDANDLEFRIFSSGYHSVETPVTEAFNGAWHHVAGVYDGSALNLYVDGELMAATAHSGPINTDTNYYVNLGRNSQGDSNNRWWYGGAMDDVRLYSRALSQEELQKMLRPEYASMPNPVDGAKNTWPDVVLGWTPGTAVVAHDVYLGTVLDDVSNASRANPLGVLVSQSHDAVAYDPLGQLEFDQTYYWRIDEVGPAPDNTIYPGDVWSFRVPFAFPIAGITATASSSNKSDTGPENTVNGSGLDENDLHGTEATTMWLSAKGDPAWIQYDFGRPYKLHEMLAWNYNVRVERVVGFGFKDVTVEYSMDGLDWTVLGDSSFSQGPSQAAYAANTILDFGNVVATSVRLTAKSNWSGRDQYGLSEVRFLAIPTHAQEPQPASEQTGVPRDVTLGWRAGREADLQEIYFSSDEQSVIDGTALIDVVSENRYALSALDLGTAYYWKVNDVNEAESPSIWEGAVWNFTTTTYLVVDDFESYDNEDNRIYDTWIDGWANETGSVVGYEEEPFAEQTIVYGGGQSMPVTYDNTSTATSSVAERTFALPQDWTVGGAMNLTVYFYGDTANDANEPMWVRLTDQSGGQGDVTYGLAAGEDIANQATMAWTQWDIALADFGVNSTQIKSIAIGFGDPGGISPRSAGLVYFDDIRIHRPASIE